MQPACTPLRLPPSGLRGSDLRPDLPDQFGSLGEPHRLVEREHQRAVDLDVVDAVRSRHESKVRKLLAEFLQDCVGFTEATSQPTSGVPYSSRPYCRSVKLRLPSVQMRTFPGPSRYMSCASDPRKTPATNVFDPPSAAVV